MHLTVPIFMEIALWASGFSGHGLCFLLTKMSEAASSFDVARQGMDWQVPRLVCGAAWPFPQRVKAEFQHVTAGNMVKYTKNQGT